MRVWLRPISSPPTSSIRLRLEDLLGFRRNPITKTPLFTKFGAKALDGHPTPTTPFVRLSTGASGVGVASSLGLAFGAKDYFGAAAPFVHIVEGEGGLTPGRAAEALAGAGTASLGNAILHLDWNQASIDSNRVCREGGQPGDYVQWSPMELFYLHDWNVIYVPDGKDFQQVFAAQRAAVAINNGQPTAVIYRTMKGWQYGIEGKAAHGAGHKLCSDGFCKAVADLTGKADMMVPTCEAGKQRCQVGPDGAAIMEQCFWESLGIVRKFIEDNRPTVEALAARVVAARDRLNRLNRRPRSGAPRVEAVYELAGKGAGTPAELKLKPGSATTLRAELGRALQHLNKASGGAIFAGSADLLGSTSVNIIGAGFGDGYWNAVKNPGARILSIGGICEDGMTGILSGLSTFGHHIGAGSSYGAFIAAARPYRLTAARYRGPGEARGHGPALPADLRHLRPRGPEDRRGWTHARRSPAAPVAPGELPQGHGHHADSVGSPGDLAAGGRRAGKAARDHRPLRDAPQRERPRPRAVGPGPRGGRRERRLPAAEASREG